MGLGISLNDDVVTEIKSDSQAARDGKIKVALTLALALTLTLDPNPSPNPNPNQGG